MIWFLYGSRDSSVGIVTRLRAGGSESRIPAKALQLFLQKRPEGLCGQTTLLFIWYSFSPGVKTDHSPLSTAWVDKDWSYSSNSPYALTASCIIFHGKRDLNFRNMDLPDGNLSCYGFRIRITCLYSFSNTKHALSQKRTLYVVSCELAECICKQANRKYIPLHRFAHKIPYS